MVPVVRISPSDVVKYLTEVEPDRSRAEEFLQTLRTNYSDPQLRSYLNRHGLRIALHAAGLARTHIDRIIERYTSAALQMVCEQPFQLRKDIKGISLSMCCAIWRRLSPTVSDRSDLALAVAEEVISNIGRDGNVYADRNAIVRTICNMAGVLPEEAERACGEVERVRGAVTFRRNGVLKVANARSFDQEKSIANEIMTRFCEYPCPSTATILKAMNLSGIKVPDPLQIDAVRTALTHQVSIITGGPGTGKSTIIKAIAMLLREQDPRIRIKLGSLAARIARAVGARTGVEADTIHAILGHSDNVNTYHAGNPLPVDTMIIEEAFMLGNGLFLDLLRALPPLARLIIIGDHQQLQPIQEGKPVEAIMRSGSIPVVRLDRNHRSLSPEIPAAGRRAMQGLVPTSSEVLQIVATPSSKAALATTISHFVRLSERQGETVQILTALHNGRLGTLTINRAISGKDEISIGELVMQIKNDRERGIFNGEIGIVTARTPTGLTMVRDDGTSFFYRNSEVSQLRRAWAISYHKSQGLEYDHVIMIVARSHLSMLNRNMINVGITRAKKTCIIIDHANALAQALARDTGESRTTLLTDLMQGRNPLS